MAIQVNGTRYLNINETARLLGITPATLANQPSQGRDPVPATRFGHGVWYAAAIVEEIPSRMRMRG